MNDRDTRRESLRVPRVRSRRGASRNSSSVRSSANLEEHRLSSGPAATQALRAASSRFSLNEQFAATRQEFNHWDDDASSIYDHGTSVSGTDPDFDEKAPLSSTEGGYGPVPQTEDPAPGAEDLDSNFYDLLCLPRDTSELSQQQIRSAYYRLFILFYPDSYPEHLRPIARQQFLRVQDAFETLIDPMRRAQYDLDQFLQSEEAGTPKSEYEIAFKEAVWDRIQNGIQTNSDLGIRVDASGSVNRGSRPQILDFSLSHSVTVDLPVLQKLLQPQVTRLLSLGSKEEKEATESPLQPTIQVATPTVTVTGSTYGISRDLSLVPTSLLYDRYQPLLPLPITRQRLIQLVENKFAPLATLRYRQEFLNRSPTTSPGKFRWIKTAVELESDVLPEFSVTSRLYHHFLLPKQSEPTIAEASIQSSRDSSSIQPRIALGLYQNLHHGTGFVRADSGDWGFGPNEYTRLLSEHSTISPDFFNAEAPGATPSLELGFRTGPSDRLPVPGSSDSPGDEGGIRGLDYEINSCKHGTWAVSASATPTSVAGAVRYSRDLTLPFRAPPTSLDPGLPSAARVEAELCSNTFQDQYFALRNLWSVGRFARVGLEVGISLHNLHLSVYWSRLGQRLSVPLLIAPRSLFGSGVLFWAGAIPFAGVAALQLGLNYRRRQRKSRSHRRVRSDVSSTGTPVAIARHRYEADNITTLLAQPVEGRQKRQMALGGLVILSARYGIPDEYGMLATSEQVADVTIAVAALINESSHTNGPAVVIPCGVRKSRLPGFWDPAPGLDKILRVEYLFKGDAGVVEVGSRDELILPPQA
ncbi:putative J domain-containing protein C63.03 [Fusarium austroafricanum]|uniref:Putative J domain-containing protein C63.03 n=1 Tax=Fusarium austroafricanum TaxID=2364996 RepID=A0A8H4KD71_9HYPO|nr:putative J domain-containing protein C63.03 [Fusarium austroafricanum]